MSWVMNWAWWHDLQALFAGFAWPWMWWAFPLPFLMLFWSAPVARPDALRVPWSTEVVAPLQSQGGATRARWRWVLLWLAWWLLCMAAARPQQLGEPVTPPQTARQMMLAVDLSGSMGEKDMQLGMQLVDRLTAAKAVIADFLDRREGDRIGLLVFGDRAYSLTPLTRDRESVRAQLSDTVVGLAGRETAIGDAIALAVKRLRTQPEGQRVLILLTDGVSNAGALTPLRAAELAKAESVRVHTVAFGATQSYRMFGVQVDADDPVDEATLQRVAADTGGRFFRARDTGELAGIYALLDRLEPVQVAGAAVRPRIERYAWPLAGALLLAMLALGWPGRRR